MKNSTKPILTLPTHALYKITKLGKTKKPYNPDSDYGDKQPYYVGVYMYPPEVGKSFCLFGMATTNPKFQGIRTSIVTKILSHNTFETMNSIYKYEPYYETKNI